MDPNPIQPVQSPPTPTPDQKPDKGIPVLVLIPVLIIIVASIFFLPPLLRKQSSSTQRPITDNQELSVSSVTPSPPKPPYTIPTGSQTYRFSHGKDVTGPKVQVATFDPLDPKVGSTQTITLEIESPTPLESARITLSSDNQEKTLTLKLTKGSALKGTYQTSWVVDDTFDLKYAIRYLLLSANDKFDNTMYIR